MRMRCPTGRTPKVRWMVLGGALATLLAGCGQRGALFLPGETRNVVVTAPPASTAAPAPGSSATPDAAPATPTNAAPATSDSTEEQRRDKPTTPAK